MPALLAWCAARGLSGLEGLVGVPGRLGGAIAMNAGAYGCSLAPLLRELTVFSPAGGLLRIGKDGWTASYRHFALAGENDWFIAVEAVLSLAVKNPCRSAGAHGGKPRPQDINPACRSPYRRLRFQEPPGVFRRKTPG